MNVKAYWVFIAFLIWGSGSTYWYVCRIKGFCRNVQAAKWEKPEKKDKSTNSQLAGEKAEISKDVLIFEINGIEPVITDTVRWQAAVDEWKKAMAQGKRLKMYVPVLLSEGEGVSVERLKRTRQWLSAIFDSAMVSVEAKRIDRFQDQAGFIDAFEGYFMLIEQAGNVKKLAGNKALIYFPYNGTKAKWDRDVLDYLDEVVRAVRENKNLKIRLTGHTDNRGNPAFNKRLGYRRAFAVKRVLLKKGVPSRAIIVRSEGENKPVADNSTPEGRRMNRRVELEILKH